MLTLDDLSEEQLTKAHSRYEMIKPFVEGETPLSQLSRLHNRSPRTLAYWVAHFRKEGVPGLAPKTRSDKGSARMSKKTRTLVQAVALSAPRRRAASVHREVVAEARREGWKPPSYRQVLRVVNDIPDSLWYLAHEGTKAHKQKYDLLVRFEAQSPNERWQVDHKHLNVWLFDSKGQPKKPWVTVVEDDYSRSVLGYYLHFEAPSAQCVALALRKAIRPKADSRWPMYGVPNVFYSDNGPDFRGHRVEHVAAHLGIELVFSIPYQPRGRGKIERFFETLEQEFLPTLPGFLPGGRPPEGQELLPIYRCDELLREWILGTYHTRVHGGTGQAPLARWEGAAPVPLLPESLEDLDVLLLTVPSTRVVQREGVRFDNRYYSDLTLAAYVGEEVVIRHDPSDVGELRVYHEGTYVCRAVCFELVGGSFSQKEARKANSKNRSRLRAELRDYKAVAEELMAAKRGDPSDPYGPYEREEPHSSVEKEEDAEYELLRGYDDE